VGKVCQSYQTAEEGCRAPVEKRQRGCQKKSAEGLEENEKASGQATKDAKDKTKDMHDTRSVSQGVSRLCSSIVLLPKSLHLAFPGEKDASREEKSGAMA